MPCGVKVRIFHTDIKALPKGNPFIGVLYAGIMLTPSGPKVLEFNVRFGDPETQVILPLLDMKSQGASDLGQIMMAAARGCLDSVAVSWKQAFACAVVGASAGYPASYKKGHEIQIPSSFDSLLSNKEEQVTVYHAGTALSKEGKLVTSGGRVLSVTGVASSLIRAIDLANSGISQIKFEGIHFRTDIGYRAIAYLDSAKKAGTTFFRRDSLLN
jgi:phosphoribosylamine--glycine ligase/phosphoribosylformylglycinamidine cyclo-ligase